MLRVHAAVPFKVFFLLFPALLFASAPTQYEVTGILVALNGGAQQAPVYGMSVLLLNHQSEQIASDQSDSQGRFTLVYQVTSVDPGDGADLPAEFKLGASYPNPFNPRTTVPFYAPQNTRATITVYNILGQEVLRTGADVSAGSHEIEVSLGGRLSQGQYILRVQGDGFSLTRSMTFVSAGIGGGDPGIRLRTGGKTSPRISGSMQVLDAESTYRLVVVGTHVFEGKELEVPAGQAFDAGQLILTKKQYPLNITIVGEGSVREEIVQRKVTEYDYGKLVRLTAEPAHGWGFTGWSGDVKGTSPVVEITVDEEKSVTASFYNWARDTETEVVDVTNPVTGRIWMDRNLGASRAATSSTDEQAYGDLYQWGRAADGHQKRNSPTTSTRSSSDQPGHGSFILVTDEPYDWRSPQNNDLWQGAGGVNNPCPAGYRLPTKSEWDAERNSWGSRNAEGAFASPLKLSMAGIRNGFSPGSIFAVGSQGNYSSSTVSGIRVSILSFFDLGSADISSVRSGGKSVRCTKDFDPDTYVLTLFISSQGAGFARGTGSYAEGAKVTITAEPNPGYTFVNWSGDIAHIEDENAPSTTVIMPAFNIWLRANFKEITQTEVVEVTNPLTGRIWMDRNLGASRKATSNTDEQAYGNLYQWGRASDGHQLRNSTTTNTLSSSDQPGHRFFILAPDSPWDWRSPRNDDLWQGAGGINNPCPAGYRLPTESEWEAERNSWGSSNAAGASASPLRLLRAGYRDGSSGSLSMIGSIGYYWSSTTPGGSARFLSFRDDYAGMGNIHRVHGLSVRCTKDFDPGIFTLDLHVSPDGSGIVSGAGRYFEGLEIAISAEASPGFTFVNWSGDTAHIEDENAPGTTVTIPAFDISLTANFEEITQTEVVDVTNPVTGKVWMDRNLGASRAATSSTDEQAYGNLYQWGRASDGHQLRNSPNTSTLSSSALPAHGDFILSNSMANFDWVFPQNDNLWQGAGGVNNPCPAGYRLPTDAEWDAERTSWSSSNAAGAFSSPLKLPMAGSRGNSSGSLLNVDSGGFYWSNSVSGSSAWHLVFGGNSAAVITGNRADGHSVRCIKN